MKGNLGRGGSSGDDTRGVSQAVSVVLLIAIVALLAAGVGTYFVAFGGELDEPAPRFAPLVTYDDELDGDGQKLTVTHESGDRIPTDRLSVRIQDAVVHNGSDPGARTRARFEDGAIEAQVGETFRSPDTIELNASAFVAANDGQPLGSNESVDLSAAAVRIVWESDSSTRTAVIFEWHGPNRNTTT